MKVHVEKSTQRKSIRSENNWIFASNHRCYKQLRIQKRLIDLVYVGQRCQLVTFNFRRLLVVVAVGLLNCCGLLLRSKQLLSLYVDLHILRNGDHDFQLLRWQNHLIS